MSSFKEVEKVKFELPYVLTWGVKKDKNFGYSIPVALDDENALKVVELSEKNDTKNPLYGNSNTIYLRVLNLTPKQKKELLDKGRSHIKIHFTLEGVRTSKSGEKYLQFKILGMGKRESDDDYCSVDL